MRNLCPKLTPFLSNLISAIITTPISSRRAQILLLAVAPALFAQTLPTQIKLSNGLIAISLDSDTGSITSMVDVGTGVPLVSVPAGVYHALWALNLDAATGTLPYGDNNSSRPTVTVSSDSTGTVANLVWHGIEFTNGVSNPHTRETRSSRRALPRN